MPRIDRLALFDAEAFARLVAAPDANELGRALLDIGQAIAGVDELFGYIVVDDAEPLVLVSQSRLPGVERRVQLYVNRFYRHDPAVRAIRGIAPGESFVQRIARSTIVQHDYRGRCFEEPGFAEKLSFGWRGERYLLVISFYGTDARDGAALTKLANLASMTLGVLVRQYAPINRGDALETIERRLRRSFPALSMREAQICARTILGWSAARIATAFSIAGGTVLTYRQRAYSKAGVTAAAELVAEILD